MKSFVVSRILLCAALLGALAPAWAETPPTVAAMQAALDQNLGDGLSVSKVSATPLPGIYEVYVDHKIIYADRAGKYMLVGQLIQTQGRKNLTEASLQAARKTDFASLPLADAIKTVKGNGSRKMAIFADPYCPFCKRLEQTLQHVDNVTIYTFLFPVLTPNSKPMSRDIWCSPNRDAAWTDWMLKQRKPQPQASCNAGALDSNLALGGRLDVSATPTIIFANGARMSGAQSLATLNSALDQAGR